MSDDAPPQGIQLQTTPELLDIFDARLPNHNFQESFPSSILADERLQLKDLAKLLQGSKIYYPPAPKKQPNPAHEKHMAKLRQEMAERDYQNLVAAKSSSVLADTRHELRILKNQLSTIINVLLSIFTAAMAAWYWTPHWTTGMRVLGSLGAALALGAVESFLYLRYLQKIEQGRKYEAGKKSKFIVKKDTTDKKND